MLAQNFKTPAFLGIKAAEFEALTKVLGMLEREEIPARMFTMTHVGEPECGTAGCIKGWACSVSGQQFRQRTCPPNLMALFFPGAEAQCDAYKATREQAAIALRNYLTHGEPRWAEAFA